MSTYLDAWGGQGVLGLLCLLWFLFILARTSLAWSRSLAGFARPVATALFATMIGAFVMMIAETRFLTNWFFYYFILFMALLSGSTRSADNSSAVRAELKTIVAV